MSNLIVCVTCGAGPFVHGDRPNMMHWYDTGHRDYRRSGRHAAVDDSPDAWLTPESRLAGGTE